MQYDLAVAITASTIAYIITQFIEALEAQLILV